MNRVPIDNIEKALQNSDKVIRAETKNYGVVTIIGRVPLSGALPGQWPYYLVSGRDRSMSALILPDPELNAFYYE